MTDVILTQERLKELLKYNPDTGLFSKYIAYKNISKNAGSLGKDGYVTIRLNKVKHRAGILAWFYFYGEWPKGCIDHINGIRQDNRISNLREVTIAQNAQNIRVPFKNNKSGFLGVSFNKKTNKFSAYISKNHKNIYLGEFLSAEIAHEHYLMAKRRLHECCEI